VDTSFTEICHLVQVSLVGTKGSADKNGHLDLARPSGTSLINTYILQLHYITRTHAYCLQNIRGRSAFIALLVKEVGPEASF